MKVVIQRVKEAAVIVNNETIGKIGKGVLVFVSVDKGDTQAQVEAMVKKVSNFRMFPGPQGGKMDLAASEAGAEFLVVSQFTLSANCNDGNRPSFDNAAPPEEAEKFYNLFVVYLQKGPCRVATGKFRARMDVALVNDGPVTFVLQSK